MDGSHYVGELINGVASGKGIRKYRDGQSYSGDWLNGKAEGQGVFKTGNGDQFTGTFSDGRASGRGEWKYKNRDNYVGEVLDGQANGNGVYTWANGNKYVGDFVNGKKNGIGTLFGFRGGRYEGQFVNDEISGRGVVYDLAGNIVERGRYVRGQLVESINSDQEALDAPPRAKSDPLAVSAKTDQASTTASEVQSSPKLSSNPVVADMTNELEKANAELTALKAQIAAAKVEQASVTTPAVQPSPAPSPIPVEADKASEVEKAKAELAALKAQIATVKAEQAAVTAPATQPSPAPSRMPVDADKASEVENAKAELVGLKAEIAAAKPEQTALTAPVMQPSLVASPTPVDADKASEVEKAKAELVALKAQIEAAKAEQASMTNKASEVEKAKKVSQAEPTTSQAQEATVLAEGKNVGALVKEAVMTLIIGLLFVPIAFYAFWDALVKPGEALETLSKLPRVELGKRAAVALLLVAGSFIAASMIRHSIAMAVLDTIVLLALGAAIYKALKADAMRSLINLETKNYARGFVGLQGLGVVLALLFGAPRSSSELTAVPEAAPTPIVGDHESVSYAPEIGQRNADGPAEDALASQYDSALDGVYAIGSGYSSGNFKSSLGHRFLLKSGTLYIEYYKGSAWINPRSPVHFVHMRSDDAWLGAELGLGAGVGAIKFDSDGCYRFRRDDFQPGSGPAGRARLIATYQLCVDPNTKVMNYSKQIEWWLDIHSMGEADQEARCPNNRSKIDENMHNYCLASDLWQQYNRNATKIVAGIGSIDLVEAHRASTPPHEAKSGQKTDNTASAAALLDAQAAASAGFEDAEAFGIAYYYYPPLSHEYVAKLNERGVSTLTDFVAALDRMDATHYPTDPTTSGLLYTFLADEQEAAYLTRKCSSVGDQCKLTAADVRNKRDGEIHIGD